jgi:hypothetical protein
MGKCQHRRETNNSKGGYKHETEAENFHEKYQEENWKNRLGNTLQ